MTSSSELANSFNNWLRDIQRVGKAIEPHLQEFKKKVEPYATFISAQILKIRKRAVDLAVQEIMDNLDHISNEELAQCWEQYGDHLPKDFKEEVCRRLRGEVPRGRPYALRCLREDTLRGYFKTDEYKKAAKQSIVLSIYESTCAAVLDGRIKTGRSKSLVARGRIAKIFRKKQEWVRTCCREARNADRFPREDISSWKDETIRSLVDLFPDINQIELEKLCCELKPSS